MSDNQTIYSVLVSNIGWVLPVSDNMTDKGVAWAIYELYVRESKTGEHSSMAYKEQVSLWASDDPDPLETYEPETDDDEELGDSDDDAMHECKFCHCLDTVEGGHACQEFTDAGNAPEGTPEHDLWESVMNGLDSGFRLSKPRRHGGITMKTIRLSDEEYGELLYILEQTSFALRYSAHSQNVKVAKLADELASTILANTNQHDDDDDNGLDTVDDSQENERWERI